MAAPSLSVARAWARHAFASQLRRKDFFAALVLIGFANGLISRVLESAHNIGWFAGLMNTFDISAIVWVAIYMVPTQIWKETDAPVTRPDLVVGAICLAAFFVPIAQMSWLALSGLSIYLLCSGEKGSHLRETGWLLLALSIPMLWARLMLSALSGPILRLDATMVSKLVGSTHVDNAVRYLDGSGVMWIAPTCSSLANITLAQLCWIAFLTGSRTPWSAPAILWGILACIMVAGFNVARLVILALNPTHHALLHGPIGNAVVSWITTAALVVFCWYGIRLLNPRQGNLAHA
ncbi:hypothetical protein GCM10007301_00560 [Azorhizobium oxalatiphilum]|uniref:Exosortase/archaeosortase family protein n=1 Tax=Azorhizobium oxalatiphilum TaxID=980631 RepID=A0A917BJH5_9HYPH|nr:hypothetical protein [Azorhizobium oxalatiphilum]GGF44927.1 hypothetical protein GCM10007301_00560 [Azorhizobium oxalatiphilum]